MRRQSPLMRSCFAVRPLNLALSFLQQLAWSTSKPSAQDAISVICSLCTSLLRLDKTENQHQPHQNWLLILNSSSASFSVASLTSTRVTESNMNLREPFEHSISYPEFLGSSSALSNSFTNAHRPDFQRSNSIPGWNSSAPDTLQHCQPTAQSSCSFIANLIA